MLRVVGHGDAGQGSERINGGERPDEARLAALAQRMAYGPDAHAARVARALEIVLAEWEMIPRYDPDHDDTLGIVHGHAVYLPGGTDADGRCDCPDHRYRDSFCKHLIALDLVSSYDFGFDLTTTPQEAL